MTPADFVGRWQIGRVILDRVGGQDGRFDGVAILSPLGPTGLSYVEAGQLRMGQGPVMTAGRRYLWAFQVGQVVVSFADTRPFHSFQPGISGDGTDHLCGADMYRVSYGFSDWPVWSAVWQVSGPRKDYILESWYWR